MAFPDHRIPFPVANPLAGRDHSGALINGDLIGDLPASTRGAIALPPDFLAAQGARERPAGPFIPIEILI
jgi:hypothetical protein